MLSFVYLNEDFFDPDVTTNLDGEKQASLFDVGSRDKMVIYNPSRRVTDYIPLKERPNNFIGPTSPDHKETFYKADTYNTPNYAVTKDRFGKDVIARIPGNGGEATYQSIDQYMKDKGIDTLPQEIRNARDLSNARTTFVDRLKFTGNRAANWAYQNPVPTALLGAAGVYALAQNRDRIKNSVQNFMPNRNSAAGY